MKEIPFATVALSDGRYYGYCKIQPPEGDTVIIEYDKYADFFKIDFTSEHETVLLRLHVSRCDLQNLSKLMKMVLSETKDKKYQWMP